MEIAGLAAFSDSLVALLKRRGVYPSERARYNRTVDSVRNQYERWPYPRVPLLASVAREQLWQLNLSWLSPRCGQAAPANPRIWIAGCGTFQPYVFARANPGAQIFASDLSQRSLDLAARRCRFHGIRSVEFRRIDLEKETDLPAGPFDFIECYGVLMSLADPAAAIRSLAARLAPGGVLRLMVYPHYSRRRIFQIQRLAKLLGLRHDDPEHPALLRALMRGLPTAHPLRATFLSYADSKNEEGLVDGFLHASDRGFRAPEFFAMTEAAGLAPAFYFHRPWGQPEIMDKALGMTGKHPAIVLDELDAWQELRTNFIACFVKKDAPIPPSVELPAKHPLFDLDHAAVGWRHRMRLRRMAVTGATLPSRTHAEPLRLGASEFRELLRGSAAGFPENAKEILPHRSILPRGAALPPQPPSSRESLPVRIGENVPNPLYAHLFEAWNRAPLAEQIERWRPHSDPLEDEHCPFGLTPMGSLLSRREETERGLRQMKNAASASFGEIRFRDEQAKRAELRAFLRRFPLLPALAHADGAWRELWILLFSFPQLLMDIDKESAT